MSEIHFARVKLVFHWGYSVAAPTASKAKETLPIPPPTTLIGALSYGMYRGLDSIDESGDLPFKSLAGVRAAARYSENFLGYEIDDVVRNVVVYFQDREHYDELYGQRSLNPKYMYNIVPSGKIYAPDRSIYAVFVTDSIDAQELEKLCWSIVRVGSKEGLVSVESVEIGNAEEIHDQSVETMYYFPASVPIKFGQSYVDYYDFWEKGWGPESPAQLRRYAVPKLGSVFRLPRIPELGIRVYAKEAFKIELQRGGSEIVVFG